MKIKSINQLSFEISIDTVTLVTDPLAHEEFGIKFPKTEGDVAVFSQKKYEGKESILKGFDKLVPKSRSEIFEVNGEGEYEVAQMLIQRPHNAPYYIFDSGYSRIVYLGLESKNADVNMFKDLGNVDVMIVPVGNGENFVDYEKLQHIISEVEPGILVPYGYKQGDMKNDLGLKTKEEFIAHFGYTNSKEEKMIKVTSKIEGDELPMEVVFLS
jgi:hypothetical protein